MMELWQISSLLIVLLSFSLSAILIMLSRLFSNKMLEQWAKGEMIFAISTLLLVIFFYLLFTAGEEIAVSTMKSIVIANYEQQGIYITSAQFDQLYPMHERGTILHLCQLYMDNTYSCLRTIAQVTYAVSAPLFFAETFTKDFFMADVVSGWGFKPLTQTAVNIINYSVFTAFLYMVFRQILEFVSFTALPLFFPIGIFLRAFPPTRGSGAYVLAFVAGFYFVFPLAYLLVVNLSMNPFVCGVPDEFPGLPNMCNTGTVGGAENIFMWIWGHMQDILGFFEKIIERGLKGVFVNLCCLPFLAMVITMSFILSSTNLLGANLPEVGRGFIKLI